MKQSRIDFIKEAHQAACSTWKARIEKEFPKLFYKEEFKVGDWVVKEWNDGDFDVLRISKIEGSQYYSDLYFRNNKRHNTMHMEAFSDFCIKDIKRQTIRKATPPEIESHLIAEAERMGYKEGVRVSFDDDSWVIRALNTTSTHHIYSYNDRMDVLYASFDVGHSKAIYRRGQWAEIIEQTPKDIQSLIEKYGKDKIKEYL